MKAFLMKHWAAVLWIVTVLIDEKTKFLESVFSEHWQIVIAQVIGSLILAYKWNPSVSSNAKLDVSANTDPMRLDNIPKGAKF